MRIAEWIARLNDVRTLEIDVAGAAGLAQARAEHRRDAIYVIPLAASALPSRVVGRQRQIVTRRVGAVIAVSNARDPRGGAAVSELEAAGDMIARAWLGWAPPAGDRSGASYAGGRLLTFADRTVWWQEEYQADYLITQQREE